MALLAIETATQQMGVAVWEGERVLSSYEVLAEYPHVVELPGAVSRVLKVARITLQQVEAIVVDIGPGSFTGLRIGLAFAKSLAFPTKTPLVGVPSLDVLAAQVPCGPWPVCPMLDAKRANVYAALYRPQDGALVKQSDYLLAPVQEVLALIREPTIVLGDGSGLYREQILERCRDAQIAPPDLWLPRAATLARLGWSRFAKGQRDAAADLTPMYLYPQTCQIRLSDRPPGAPRKPAKTT